jgi:hypothetical protein
MLAPGVKAAEEEAKAPLPFSKLRLLVSVGATKSLLGEPIAVYVGLTNPTRAPVLAHRAFSWRGQGGAGFGDGERYLRLILTRDSQVEDFRPYGMPDVMSGPPRPALIEPGAVLRTKELLVGEGPFGRSIQSVGTVEIAARFRNARARWDDLIASSPVRVTVVAPEGRDAEAFQWLRERRAVHYLGYLYFGKLKREEQEKALKAFLEKYAQTTYSPYAAFGLGQTHFWRQRYAQAIQTFKDVAERHPKSSVAEDALYLAAESYRNVKKPVEADQTLRELLKRYPDTPAADDAQAALAEIAREPEMLFHEDRRLDAKITFEVPAFTLAEDAFKVVSRLTGVPLRVSPGGWDLRCHGGQRTQTVRAFMAEFDRGPHRWVREPDGGYRLVPGIAPK